MAKKKNQRIIVVSNRVPYKISRTRKGIKYKKSVGGLVTALDPILQKQGGLWIGWNGLSGRNKFGKKIVGMEGYKVKFLNLSKKDVKFYYHGFSNRTLWPLFHGFIFQAFFNLNYWKSYRRINNKFANEVLEEVKDDDTIWVQDYHLTLLPSILRSKRPKAKILYFLHIPFPCNEIYRVLPWNRQILEGLLGCDVVGFQTKRDAQNFLYSCKQELGLFVDHGKGTVDYNGRQVNVKSFPISIDYGKFNNIAKKSSIDEVFSEFNAFENVKLVISVERLDYTKGIKERIYSIQRFFEKYPEYRKKVIFVQISVPSRTKIKEYIQFKREIDELVGNINGQFADELWSPINYIYKTIPQERLISYYKAADICLVTPLRDGMNLIAKEYVSSNPEGNGVLVLSRFAGSAEEMSNHSIMVNPFDFEGVANSIKRGLEMPVKEREKKLFALREIVKENNIYNWSKDFLKYAQNR
ncbi:MAG: alpha,alpha-trehalose-phosphate synthase (UDP-forming) [Actinomycetota bacterium]